MTTVIVSGACCTVQKTKDITARLCNNDNISGCLVCVYSVLDASYAQSLILNKTWEKGTDHVTDKTEAQKG